MKMIETEGTTERTSGSSFLDAYKDYAINLTDAPIIFHDMIGLSLMSLAVGHSPIETSPKEMYPNIWLLIVGLSGISRKSTALDLAQSVRPSGSCLLPNDFTKEALIEELSRNPQGISIWDECGSLLKQVKYEKNYQSGLDDVLCLLYSLNNPYRRKLRSGEFCLEKICFNLLWATTASKFLKIADSEHIISGFLARFLIVYGEKEFSSPRRNLKSEDYQRKENAKKLLQQVWDYFHCEQRSFIFETPALEIANAWQMRKEDELRKIADLEEADAKGALITRLSDYLLKFSALYEVDSLLRKDELRKLNTPQISISINSANKVVSIIDNLLSILSDKLLSSLSSTWLRRNLEKLSKILKDAPDDWVQRQYVLPRMKITAKQFTDVLTTAYESGIVDVKNRKPQLIKLLKK
jgi:hypothetical protein